MHCFEPFLNCFAGLDVQIKELEVIKKINLTFEIKEEACASSKNNRKTQFITTPRWKTGPTSTRVGTLARCAPTVLSAARLRLA